MSSIIKHAAVVVLIGATLAGASGEASARNRYTHSGSGYYGARHHRGIGVGGAVAGAALGIIGAAAGAAAYDHYYNGYPAYSYSPGYGPGYGDRYGYDYHEGHGYYGPY